jgi:F0F1-type ATP synthase delta subunit
MGTVSVRYARALLLYALEQGESEQVYADMQALVERLRFIPAIRVKAGR